MGDIYKDDSVRDSDDEVEDDGDGEWSGREMLGFIFGNVDDSGELDEEYLDQAAKEHLSALAHELGPSLLDIEQLHAKRRTLTDTNADEEHENYDQKAEDAVDYEDEQEQYEGPEVQLTPQDMPFCTEAALTGPSKVVEEDSYDEDDDFDWEQPGDAMVEDEDFDFELPADAWVENKDCDFEQPADIKMGSPVENVSETEDEEPLTEEDDEEIPMGQEQCRFNTEYTEAFDYEVEVEVEDWDHILGSQEIIFSSKELEEEASKISLPVLYQEDGKTVLRFSELSEVPEPYWVIGHRKGRHKQVHIRERRDPHEEEDDEETILRSCSQQPVLSGESSSTDGDFQNGSISEASEGRSAVDKDGNQTAHVLSHTRRNWVKQKKLVFASAEPMKRDCDMHEFDIAEFWRQIPDANFDPLHEVEWEDGIIWDGSDSSRRGGSIFDHRASRQLIELDSDSELSHLSENDHERLLTDQSEVEPIDYSTWQRPGVVEPLCQRSRKLEDENELLLSAKSLRHPQMLRLHTRSLEKGPDGEARAELLKRINIATLEVKEKNQELARGDWLSSIFWEDLEPGLSRPKVILDLMDPDMVFETSEATNFQSLSLHAAAVVLISGGKEGAPDGAEGTFNASLSLNRFNISNDQYYTNEKPHHHKSNAKKRVIHEVKVLHSLPAIKLLNVQFHLSDEELANFHRPKAIWYPHHNEVTAKEQGKLASRGPMIVFVRTLGGMGCSLTVDASETLDVLKAKAAQKLGDRLPSEKTKVFYSGKELVVGFTFAQHKIPPRSVLELVHPEVYPWPEAQRLPGEDEPVRPPGAFQSMFDLSVKDGHVALMEYCEEKPLLLANVGMGARLCTYYRQRSPTDADTANHWVGISLPLEPTEDSPFLGDIRPGESQSSLETNMYRAPVFSHKVASTDFLAVRSMYGKLSLRRIDSVHVVGQQEPHMKVLTPSSQSMQNYVANRVLVFVYRAFREEFVGETPSVLVSTVKFKFPSLTQRFLRYRLKHCAYRQRTRGEMHWMMRRNFRIPSEEDIRRLVTPENVCTHESMQAGLHHLKRMGVHKLTEPSGLAAAMNELPDKAITIAVASRIERELQITPWNLSSDFVAAIIEGSLRLERLEIVGAGDPSGRGLGFSYLRAATKPPNAVVEKKAAAKAITRAGANLCALGNEAAREVLLKFKVPEDTIGKLTRWDRVAMVRKLSTEHAASGVELGDAGLSKFARAQRVPPSLRQQQTEKCQDIWDRQVQSLSMIDSGDSESDGEAGGDLDSFADELENLLEAEEGDEDGGELGRLEGMDFFGARRYKQIARQEEGIEDEEAEAAEFQRMFRAGLL